MIEKIVLPKNIYKEFLKLNRRYYPNEWGALGLGIIRKGKFYMKSLVNIIFRSSRSLVAYNLGDLLSKIPKKPFAIIHSHQDMMLEISEGDIRENIKLLEILSNFGYYNYVTKKFLDILSYKGLRKEENKIYLDLGNVILELEYKKRRKKRLYLGRYLDNVYLYEKRKYVVFLAIVVYKGGEVYSEVYWKRVSPPGGLSRREVEVIIR